MAIFNDDRLEGEEVKDKQSIFPAPLSEMCPELPRLRVGTVGAPYDINASPLCQAPSARSWILP
jgi:hypothetical protein